MSLALRIALIVGAVIMLVLVLAKTRRAKILVGDTIFWIALSIVFVILAVFPQIGIGIASVLQVESPANFVFLVIIATLIVKLFISDMELSQLKAKTCQMAQEIGLKEKK